MKMKNIKLFCDFINESKSRINQKDYLFYVINLDNNKIWAGNEYEEDAYDMLDNYNENYDKAKLKVYTKRYILSNSLVDGGINPDDNNNWTNNIEMEKFK